MEAPTCGGPLRTAVICFPLRVFSAISAVNSKSAGNPGADVSVLRPPHEADLDVLEAELVPEGGEDRSAVDRAVAWCLHKEPEGRPPSVHALLHTLFDHAPPAAQLTIDRAARLSSGPCEVMTPVLPPMPESDPEVDERAAAPTPPASHVQRSWVERALALFA